ncbi:Mitochondrial distribution and morphology protein 34 [Cladophialophora carrionii]|uniref:Mitochondrial distribution and morphology protein 34 n=1 Tax=Cladophialophora carrionii TaxID=86049 RepID=A0A1C1C6R3_9EURO|nr:Mitochondrial distribution and morphology protein 34 [Cladophialophora carrionii]
MAFNFNWSPLSTDAGFLPRAQELLTNALNRADPKPAIIVDDIIVNELNLGDVPPELEILEIGDLAEDRFRGTFKMMYNGNAYLTLKTKVQANPLNTYLRTRSAFATPQPLAADTGLTIPLQITLSEFRLSGFIILVFSRQKGLTLVFRNDPLESLRVSSTFDSIPFVANFLQKEIETQLRGLLMDELPAIIHRLSLQLLVPERNACEERKLSAAPISKDEVVIDPLASPPQDPVDSTGAVLTPAEVASLSLDSSIETQSLFSRKNLIRLATLTDSHRTLSLFTPSIRDAVFRAWTGPLERGEMPGLLTRTTTPALSRTHSYAGSLSTTTAYTFDSGSTRPTLHSYVSSSHGLSMNSGRHGQGHRTRKRKKRVVDLRPHPETGEPEMVVEDGSTADSASVSESASTAASVFSAPAATMSSDASQGLNPITPPRSPTMVQRTAALAPVRQGGMRCVSDGAPGPSIPVDHDEPSLDVHQTPRAKDPNATIRLRPRRIIPAVSDDDETPRASMYLADQKAPAAPLASEIPTAVDEKAALPTRAGPSRPGLPNFMQFVASSTNATSIAEQAWMMKMANEMARRYEEERLKGSFGPASPREEDASPPPPAYAQ